MQGGMQAKDQRKEAISVSRHSTGLSQSRFDNSIKISYLDRHQMAVLLSAVRHRPSPRPECAAELPQLKPSCGTAVPKWERAPYT
jgi:hypothetical protein